MGKLCFRIFPPIERFLPRKYKFYPQRIPWSLALVANFADQWGMCSSAYYVLACLFYFLICSWNVSTSFSCLVFATTNGMTRRDIWISAGQWAFLIWGDGVGRSLELNPLNTEALSIYILYVSSVFICAISIVISVHLLCPWASHVQVGKGKS